MGNGGDPRAGGPALILDSLVVGLCFSLQALCFYIAGDTRRNRFVVYGLVFLLAALSRLEPTLV